MSTNLERFKKDLETLISTGHRLQLAMRYECFPDESEQEIKKQLGKGAEDFVKNLPSFKGQYQRWYSEALALLRQLLPDRVADFARHYEKPKSRKEITYENSLIEDYLQGLHVTRGYLKEKVVGADAAIPRFLQQLTGPRGGGGRVWGEESREGRWQQLGLRIGPWRGHAAGCSGSMNRRPRRNWMRCDARSSEGDRLAMMNGFDAPLDGWDWKEHYGRVAGRRLKKVPHTFLSRGLGSASLTPDHKMTAIGKDAHS